MEIIKMTNHKLAGIIRGNNGEFLTVSDTLLSNTGRVLAYEIVIRRHDDGKLFTTKYLFGSFGFRPEEVELVECGVMNYKRQINYVNHNEVDKEEKQKT